MVPLIVFVIVLLIILALVLWIIRKVSGELGLDKPTVSLVEILVVLLAIVLIAQRADLLH